MTEVIVNNPDGTPKIAPCLIEPNRVIITGILLDLIRQLFSSPEGRNILSLQLKDYFWSAEFDENLDEAKYQLIIEDVYTWDPTKAGIRPGILIKPGTWVDRNLLIGDKIQGLDHSRYERMMVGSHSIFVIGQTATQTELLAREVHMYLGHFKQEIRHTLSFDKWEVAELAEISELEESDEHFVIPLTVAYQFAHAWEVKPVGPLLQHAITSINIDDDLGDI